MPLSILPRQVVIDALLLLGCRIYKQKGDEYTILWTIGNQGHGEGESIRIGGIDKVPASAQETYLELVGVTAEDWLNAVQRAEKNPSKQ